MDSESGEFWARQSLANLSEAEWEALCDGCGRCCLNKLEDEDSGAVFYTALSCHQLDTESCRCRNYNGRFTQVPDCLNVRELYEQGSDQMALLPASCAYRLRAEGRPLPDWHPLKSGSPGSVHQAGVSVRGKVLSEASVHPDEFQNHIIAWVEL